MRGEVQASVDLLATASQGYIINLDENTSVVWNIRVLKARALLRRTLATRVLSMP